MSNRYAVGDKLDISHLPKYAQAYISNLERRIRELEGHVKELSSQHPKSNVVLSGHVGEPDTTLPPDSVVLFYLDEEKERLGDTIEIRHEGNRQLRISHYGTRRILISPQSSNAFIIESEKR